MTIQSAAISFYWPPLGQEGEESKIQGPGVSLLPHNINLIDTPGHADFIFEVLRSLRILDGAVCILDGVAGIEAQTEKVWLQAAKYQIPKIIYVNKLDRDGASFGKTVKEIASRLHTWPAVCQIPWWEGGKGRFMGIGDAISLQAYRWADSGDGRMFEVVPIEDLITDLLFGEEVKKARVALIELLSEHDEDMVDKYLEHDEDHLAIPPEDVIASLRRCVITSMARIVPVFAGASFRNIGVQPLLDAIVQLLPAPNEAPDAEISLSGIDGTLKDLLDGKLIAQGTQSKSRSSKIVKSSKLPGMALVQNLEACALAFKVVHDPRQGALVYVRVYSGQINRNALLYNTNLQMSERAVRLLKMYASDSVDISEISAGQIGVIPGLKYARTGDTLLSYTGLNPKTKPPAPLDSLQLRPIEVPPAVFFSSIEPNSLSDGKAVASALALLIREDPSLQLSVDEDSGQTLLSGMGEFHLEIAGDRLINDLKARAFMGKIEIAYREAILKPSLPETYNFDKEIAGKRRKAGCIASVAPLSEIPSTIEPVDENVHSSIQDGNIITVSFRAPPFSPSSPTENLLPPHLPLFVVQTALTNGAIAALSRGVTHSFPLRNTHVSLTFDPAAHLFGPDTTPAALASASRLATKAALRATAAQAGSALLELVMNVRISVDDASLGAVSSDISSARGGHIVSLDEDSITSGEEIPHIDFRKVYTPPDPFGGPSFPSPPSPTATGSRADETETETSPRHRTITARVPLKEMIGYLKHLRSLTGGRGTFVMSADRFERVVGAREKALLKELRGF